MRQATPDILDNILTGSPGQPQATMLLLQRITNDGGTQMRAGMDPDTIKEYQDAINESESWPFPPVVVYHDGDKYWLADGFHRVNAAHRSGKYLEVPADIRAGTRRDAVLHAAGANASHGLRRTNADKRRAVETLLRDEEWGKWSRREIARRCGVSDVFVGDVFKDIQKELSANGLQMDDHLRTVQRGDQTYQQNTANIGANRPAPRVEMPEIERIVRQVATTHQATAADLRLIAKQRIGRMWRDALGYVPPGTPYRDISQAFNNVAEQIAQKQREAAPPPPPLSVDDLVDELRPHTESATVAAIEAAAHGAFNAVRQRCATVLSDFTYRVADVLDALERIADERRAQDQAAPVMVNGEQPLPEWAQENDEPARQQQLVEALFGLTRNEYAEWIQAAIDGKHPRIFVMCENMARDYHGCNLKDALRQVVQRRHDADQFGPVDTSATPPAPEPIVEEEPAVPTTGDERAEKLYRLKLTFIKCQDSLTLWEQMTGMSTITLEARRGLRKVVDATVALSAGELLDEAE